MKTRIAALVAVLILTFSVVAVADVNNLEVYFLDVGQGDCSVLRCRGQCMIIDGGGSENSQRIYSFLRNTLAVDHIDYMISTHPHNDHTVGLSAALHACTVGTVFSPIFYHEESGFLTLLRVLREYNLNITMPLTGNTIMLGDATVQFLAPQKLHSKMNDNSIVVRVVYGDTSFIFMGDAELEEEIELQASSYKLDSTLIKVGHHGSISSTSDPFLRKVNPKYAVISVGAYNTYGHPASEVLSRLAEIGTTVYRTDCNGTIKCVSDGGSIDISVEKNLMPLAFAATEADTNDASRAFVPEHNPDEEVRYIGNRKSMKFHYLDCPGVATMSEKNRIELYNREDAISMGYSPCGTCQP